MAVTRLVAVRHAPVALQGVCYGRSVVPLTVDANRAGARMAEVGGGDLLAVWSSPAPRCAQPGRVWAVRAGVPHRVDERLWELDHGQWEGLPWDTIPRDAIDFWAEDWVHRGPPDGESAERLAHRVRDWLDALGPGNHGLAAHAGVIRAIHRILSGASWPDAMRMAAPHLEPIEFEWEWDDAGSV